MTEVAVALGIDVVIVLAGIICAVRFIAWAERREQVRQQRNRERQ